MNLPLALTLALGGVAALDAVPLSQALLSQPLVTGVVLGVLWQQPALALSVAFVLQILAASTLPVGARTPEDYALGGVVGTGVALLLFTQQPFNLARDACAFAGVGTGLVASVVGVPFIKWQRRRNEALSRWCEESLRAGSEGALGVAHGAAVVLAFAVGVALTAIFLAAGYWVLRGTVETQSLRLGRAWSYAEPLWIGLGLAHLLNAFAQRRLLRAALFGASLVAAWVFLVVQGS